MSERGMGSAVGQVPEYVEMVTRWCKGARAFAGDRQAHAQRNQHPSTRPRCAARGADAVSLVNTISSIMAVDLDLMSPSPSVDGRGAHGGYCGPAIKPIALRMVGEIARDRESAGMSISGIGGISSWRDAAEFMALGAHNVQVCTAAIGLRLQGGGRHDRRPEQTDGREGTPHTLRLRRKAVPNFVDWEHLNLNYTVKAHIDQDLCIKVRPLLHRL